MKNSSAPFEMVQEIYAAFRRRDTVRIFRLFAENIEIVQSPDLPWGGCYRGHDEVREFFAALTGHISSNVSIERMIDSGDRVVVVGQTRGVVNENGAPFDVAFAHVWTVRSGRVVRAEFYVDHRAMLPAIEAAGPVSIDAENEAAPYSADLPAVESVSSGVA